MDVSKVHCSDTCISAVRQATQLNLESHEPPDWAWREAAVKAQVPIWSRMVRFGDCAMLQLPA